MTLWSKSLDSSVFRGNVGFIRPLVDFFYFGRGGLLSF